MLTPGRYVGADDLEDEGIDFHTKVNGLIDNYLSLKEKGDGLDKKIERMLTELMP